MLTDEHPVLELRQKLGALRRGEAEGRRVGPERVVGRNGLGDEIRPRRLWARIDVLPVIAVRPTVEASVLDRSHIVRDQIASELVALIYRGP